MYPLPLNKAALPEGDSTKPTPPLVTLASALVHEESSRLRIELQVQE